MENIIQYFKIWQKKRDELQLESDAASDWPDMNTLLDRQMPTNNDSKGTSLK